MIIREKVDGSKTSRTSTYFKQRGDLESGSQVIVNALVTNRVFQNHSCIIRPYYKSTFEAHNRQKL